MEKNVCLQCKRVCNDTFNRLIRDSCGHYKCRLCLLQEPYECFACAKRESVQFKDAYVPRHAKNEPWSSRHLAHAKNKKRNGTVSPQRHSNQSHDFPLRKRKIRQNQNYNREYSEAFVEETTTDFNPKNVPTDLSMKVPFNVSIADDQIQSNNETIMSFDSNKDSNCTILLCEDLVQNCIGAEDVNSSKATQDEENNCEELFSCSICGLNFKNENSYTKHMDRHEKNNYTCDICKAQFFKKSTLVRHIIAHSNIKPYKCKLCESKFNNGYSLKKHNLIHSNKKPYTCKICRTSFRDSSNLKRHELSHQNMKFICSECGKYFRRKSYLKMHLKIHTKFKTWECSFCETKFYTKKDKSRHELTHSGRKQHGCNQCDASFGRKDNLDRHIRNTHTKSNKALDKMKIFNSRKCDDVDKDMFKSHLSNREENLCSEKCLLHIGDNRPIDVVIENDQFSNWDIENKNSNPQDEDQSWDTIVEANNKRKSVIYKSDLSDKQSDVIESDLTHGQGMYDREIVNQNDRSDSISCEKEYFVKSDSSCIEIDDVRVLESSKVIKADVNDFSTQTAVNPAPQNATANVELSETDADTDSGPYYIHKKMHYDLKKALESKCRDSAKYDEFDDAKASWCIYQLSNKNNLNCAIGSKDNPARSSINIELYKKILIPKKKFH